MIAKFHCHSENTVIAKIENFAMHCNFRYDSENSSCSEFSLFRHCSIASCGYYSLCNIPFLLFFYILHSRLAEIDRKPYEIDGNQPDFVMIGLTRRFGF